MSVVKGKGIDAGGDISAGHTAVAIEDSPIPADLADSTYQEVAMQAAAEHSIPSLVSCACIGVAYACPEGDIIVEARLAISLTTASYAIPDSIGWARAAYSTNGVASREAGTENTIADRVDRALWDGPSFGACAIDSEVPIIADTFSPAPILIHPTKIRELALPQHPNPRLIASAAGSYRVICLPISAVVDDT